MFMSLSKIYFLNSLIITSIFIVGIYCDANSLAKEAVDQDMQVKIAQNFNATCIRLYDKTRDKEFFLERMAQDFPKVPTFFYDDLESEPLIIFAPVDLKEKKRNA